MKIRQCKSRKKARKLTEGKDLKKLVRWSSLFGNPKEVQAFIRYFYGVKVTLSQIARCKEEKIVS